MNPPEASDTIPTNGLFSIGRDTGRPWAYKASSNSLMKYWTLFWIALTFSLGLNESLQAQELNAEVRVTSQQVQTSNPRVFKTLEEALTNFINNRRWTGEEYELEERIRCQFIININKKNNNIYEARLQVSYSRPVYNSGYSTPVLVHQDNNFNFEYVEYEQLEFNINNFQSNLTSVIAYYIYVILGYDHDTFALKSGTPYFQKAQTRVGNSQNQGFSGWDSFDGNRNRYWLVDNMLSPAFDNFRSCLYIYHRQGLDLMHKSAKIRTAKKNIKNALLSLEKVQEKRRGSMVMAMWFDAKKNEILKIFNGGIAVGIGELKELLKKLDGNNSSDYNKLQG